MQLFSLKVKVLSSLKTDKVERDGAFSSLKILHFVVELLAHRVTVSGKAFPGGSDSKASACSAGDLGSIPGLGRSSGEGNDNPLQYSCLENSMD